MADTKNISGIQKAYVKQSDGTLGEETGFSILSENVVDTQSAYTLDKIISSYLSYIKEVPVIYDSSDGIEPTNLNHISIWIDRSENHNNVS